MKIIEYNKAIDIVVEFQDKYRAKVHTQYDAFRDGRIRNPYYATKYGVGIIGSKYSSRKNGKHTKEYNAWCCMLERCYDKKFKDKHPTYRQVSCCDEWLVFENFYDWLHSQENFDKWLHNNYWCLDKDILIKRNKIYSPETCCLVPSGVNGLFVKNDSARGKYPIGVYKFKDGYRFMCRSYLRGRRYISKLYATATEAFWAYKQYKENVIKEAAQVEYDKSNITIKCYDAMMKYEVEIDD